MNSTGMISVIIASYNTRNTIGACLGSLNRQVTLYSFEIVVADSSDDGTDDLIKEKYPQVKLVRLSRRTYPGPARNAAVSASSGDIVAFLDADCTVPENWIENIADTHRAGWKVVGGAVINGTEHSYVGTAEHIIEFSEYSHLRKAQECRMIPTCNLSLRRDIFNEVGNFEFVDTGKFLFKSEDLLLCNRIISKGYSIHFDPKIKVYHHNRMELLQFFRNQHSLGFSSAVARKLIRTRGSLFAKYILLSALIPFLKTSILMSRMASYGLSNFLNLLIHLPLIFFGSVYYTIGFIRGVRAPLKDSINGHA